jgi:hypothetical protein
VNNYYACSKAHHNENEINNGIMNINRNANQLWNFESDIEESLSENDHEMY